MKAIGVILAAGSNKRMKQLTKTRAAAAMPVAGTYRAIDFALTNMANAHVQKVAVFAQYNTRSLDEHLSSSKWWDFGRKIGGLFLYHPTITPENSNWFRGTIDSMYQNIRFLKESHEPYVIIASGDGIYHLDYNKVLDYHLTKRADITIVSAMLPTWEDSSAFGQIFKDEEGRLTELFEKPIEEEAREVNCGIYIIRRRLLIELIEACAQDERYDFVRDIIIRQRKNKRIYVYPIESYWSNIASVKSYYRTNMDFLRREIREEFDSDDFSVLTKANDFPPVKYNPSCQVKNSLIAPGSIINGTVENSVLFKKVYIGNNTVIRNSIILNDVYIGDNTTIENCIVESHNTIIPNSHYIGDSEDIRIVMEINDRYNM